MENRNYKETHISNQIETGKISENHNKEIRSGEFNTHRTYRRQ